LARSDLHAISQALVDMGPRFRGDDHVDFFRKSP
jgi:hypothetical protein